MDNAIKDFDMHLKSHPRTILSARFGDGKSTFLAAAEKKLKSRYVFIKIFPVNYQVVENLDIFELIKRDLLFQLYEKGLVDQSYEIPDEIASFFFLQNNWKTFAEEILKVLSYFDSSNSLKASLGAAKFLKSIFGKYESFKDNGGEIGNKIDRFIESFDDHKVIYEADPITSIICDIIKCWKSRNRRKKICLVFEDMDRIDPAHIFRILNVISAHMDYGYKYGISPNSYSLAGNKFSVDNIVVCLDYSNLRKIFSHFYGNDAGFDGYINKFCDKGIFYYSLHGQVQRYYSQNLARVTGMSSNAIYAFTEQFDFAKHTLREFYHALDDVESQITLPKGQLDVNPHKGLYVMSAILRRLGCDEVKIIALITQAIKAQPNATLAYLATSMMLCDGVISKGYEISLGEKDQGFPVIYQVSDMLPDGSAFISKHLDVNFDPQVKYSRIETGILYILKYVHK